MEILLEEKKNEINLVKKYEMRDKLRESHSKTIDGNDVGQESLFLGGTGKFS